MSRRIVITGLGVVSAAGVGWEKFWDALTRGESQADFIRMHKVNFMILSHSALIPGTLRPFVIKEISDPVSGDRFVILKY